MAARTGKFLTQDERDLCVKIAALNMVLVSQRAQALLLLDDGHTQVKSCELSSLTLGQLRYLLRLFKNKGIKLFPEGLFPQTEEKEDVPLPTPEIAEPETSGKKVKKERKGKKKKGKKKKKKDKKSSVKKIKKGKKEEKKKKKGKKKK